MLTLTYVYPSGVLVEPATFSDLTAVLYACGDLPPRYPMPATMANATHAMYVQYAGCDLEWFGHWTSLPDMLIYLRMWNSYDA